MITAIYTSSFPITSFFQDCFLKKKLISGKKSAVSIFDIVQLSNFLFSLCKHSPYLVYFRQVSFCNLQKILAENLKGTASLLICLKRNEFKVVLIQVLSSSIPHCKNNATSPADRESTQ